MKRLIDFLKKKLGYREGIVGVIEEDGSIEEIDENTLAILNEVMNTGNDVEGHVDDEGKLHITHHNKDK